MRHQRGSHSPKIARDLESRLAGVSDDETVPVIIRYREGATARLPKAPEMQVTHLYRVFPAIAARLPARQVQRLAADDVVERLWLDFRVRAFLDKAVPAIGGPTAWEAGFTGKGVTVAVLDTGIDTEHPDFGDRIVAASNWLKSPGQGDSGLWGSRDRSATDGNGHGTHIAGIVGGDGAASDGRYRGVAPEASLLVGKVLYDDGSGDASDVIAGLEWAYSKGAQVACLSLGGADAGDGTDALSVACDELVERGLIICVAAGNAGPRAYTIGPPGCARQVITVGAADLSRGADGAIVVATFSSRGPTSDRRVKPDLVFPGVGIVSCRASSGSMGDPVAEAGEFYARASGTSMAAPFAAGACALLLQASPEATPNQVRENLCGAASALGEDANARGSGLGNVAAALKLAQERPALPEPRKEGRGCLFSFLPRSRRG